MKEELEAALEELGKNSPELMQAFGRLHEVAGREGVLSAKTKKLIIIAIAVAIRCEPCIRMHAEGALEMGITREEILEAAGVAVLLGGGPSVAYTALHLLDVLGQDR